MWRRKSGEISNQLVIHPDKRNGGINERDKSGMGSTGARLL
jgi:hypothetical protein